MDVRLRRHRSSRVDRKRRRLGVRRYDRGQRRKQYAARSGRRRHDRGEANGEIVADFQGIVAGGGDTLQFFGYGENAAFNYVDSTHYNITPDPSVGGPTEVITFSNAPLIVDFVDVQYFA